MADKKKKFIKVATKNAHGQFSEKAKEAGKSTREYAEEQQHAPGKLGKQARLALTLMGLASHGSNNDHAVKTRSHKEVREAMYGKDK